MNKRAQDIKDKEELEQLKESEIARLKEAAENPDPDNPDSQPVPFDEEEFLKKWVEEHPEIIIPDPIEYDIDADFDLAGSL